MALSMRPSSLVPSLVSFAVHVCAIVSRETEKEREFSGTTYVQNGVSGTMGLRAIIGFATANRPRIIPPRALAYSLEDLFRYAHNRIGMPLEETIALLLLQFCGKKAGCNWDFFNWHPIAEYFAACFISCGNLQVSFTLDTIRKIDKHNGVSNAN